MQEKRLIGRRKWETECEMGAGKGADAPGTYIARSSVSYNCDLSIK